MYFLSSSSVQSLFDAILLGIVAVLFALGLYALLGYDDYTTTVNNAYARYGEEFGVNLRLSSLEYEQMNEAEQANLQAAYDALNADEEARHALGMMMDLTLLICSFGILLGFLLMEFVVPLLFQNGQTLGKKIFSLGVMHTSGIRLRAPMLFARVILGKYAIETMVPVYILLMIFFGTIGVVGPIVLFLLLILEAVVMIATHTNSMIHDLLAKTVTIDLGSQMIFETKEDLIAYKEKLHADQAAKATY